MSEWRDGVVHLHGATDRGVLLGDGLFETLLVRDAAPCFLDRHLARLRASALHLGIHTPSSLEQIVTPALPKLVEYEGNPIRGALRITVSRLGQRGLVACDAHSDVLITFSRLPDAERGVPAAPVSACVVAAPRIDPLDPLAGHKTLSYMPRVHARRIAIACGAEIALLATIDGDVAEADAANLFVVLDAVLVTPPLDRGVLPGITRARCLEAAARAGLRAEERTVSRSDLLRADEVFLTSSLDGVRPVREVDGRAVAAPGPMALRLAHGIEPAPASTVDLLSPKAHWRAQ